MTLLYKDYTIDRLGVMAQKADKLLLKIINKCLCNVQFFQKSESSKYQEKYFRYSDPHPVPVSNQFLDIRIQLQAHYAAGCPTGKLDSDHLWDIYIAVVESIHLMALMHLLPFPLNPFRHAPATIEASFGHNSPAAAAREVFNPSINHYHYGFSKSSSYESKKIFFGLGTRGDRSHFF